MEKLIIEPKRAIGIRPSGSARLPEFIMRIEGRKHWPSPVKISFEPTEHNIRLAKELWPDIVVEDLRQVSELEKAMEEATAAEDHNGRANLSPGRASHSPATAAPAFRMKPFPSQLETYNRAVKVPVFAIFSEQGTGKTKVCIDVISNKYLTGMIDAVVIYSSPKGVHRQWIEDQFPEHIWEGIQWEGSVWAKNNFTEFKDSPSLKVYSANIESILTRPGQRWADKLYKRYGRRLMMIIDESQSIKNAMSKRSKALKVYGDRLKYKMIMTGTPLPKNLYDEWSQFRWLDERIIGIKYKSAFLSEYCILGGFENRSIVGNRNVEKFNKLIAPYTFRATKDELNLPPKMFDEIDFDMTDEQLRMQKELKAAFIAEIDKDSNVVAKNAAAAFVKMHQLACGHVIDEFGNLKTLKRNPRLDTLEALIRSTENKYVIWCRFKADIKLICERFKSSSVHYYGETNTEERAQALRLFKDPDSHVKLFVASPAAAGAGIDGLQEVCSRAVYYSNSFNALDRWQSEDRLHRIGTKNNVMYYDLIANRSVDKIILRNLKAKKSFSDLTLSELRSIINEIE